jgi:predicted DNA-binding protein
MAIENNQEKKPKTKLKLVSFRMSWELYEKVNKLAKQNDSVAPMSHYIRKVLADHVKEKENE